MNSRFEDRLNRWLLHRAYASKLKTWKDANACQAFSSRQLLHEHVASSVGADTPIEYLEFGVYKGATVKLWCENNAHPDSRFVGFDSFEGLPERWNDRYQEGHFSTAGAVPLIEDSRVDFRRGWFNETLPHYLNEQRSESQTVIYLDADLYSSTLYVLCRMAPHVNPGTIIIFDDFLYALDVYKAFDDFNRSFPLQYRALAQVPSRKGTPFSQVALEVVATSPC